MRYCSVLNLRLLLVRMMEELKGSKKLSDYYTDMKIDTAVRGRIPLLVTKKSPGAIVALPGLQVSEQFKVTGESAFLLKITLL